MTITVQTKRGRLIIRDGERLVTDKGGDYTDAVTNGAVIFALLRSGRVQELRIDGNFIRDVIGAGAAGIRLTPSGLLVRTIDGRFDEYRDGRRVKSTGSAPPENIEPARRGRPQKNEAEELGAKFASWLIDLIVREVRGAVRRFRARR